MLAIKNGFEELALAICDSGADVTVKGSDNVPPIIVAVEKGYKDLVRQFIKLGMVPLAYAHIVITNRSQ